MCGWVDGTKVSETLVALIFNMQSAVIRQTLLLTYQITRRHLQYESNYQE